MGGSCTKESCPGGCPGGDCPGELCGQGGQFLIPVVPLPFCFHILIPIL